MIARPKSQVFAWVFCSLMILAIVISQLVIQDLQFRKPILWGLFITLILGGLVYRLIRYRERRTGGAHRGLTPPRSPGLR